MTETFLGTATRREIKSEVLQGVSQDDEPPACPQADTHNLLLTRRGKPAYLHDIFQSLLCVCFLCHQFGCLEVSFHKEVTPFGSVPVRPRNFHQAVPQQQHEEKQAPGVGSGDPDGLELVPNRAQVDSCGRKLFPTKK